MSGPNLIAHREPPAFRTTAGAAPRAPRAPWWRRVLASFRGLDLQGVLHGVDGLGFRMERSRLRKEWKRSFPSAPFRYRSWLATYTIAFRVAYRERVRAALYGMIHRIAIRHEMGPENTAAPWPIDRGWSIRWEDERPEGLYR